MDFAELEYENEALVQLTVIFHFLKTAILLTADQLSS